MFKIYDGRDNFYQWDLNRKLIVEDSSIKEVHFCNRTDSCSLVCEVYTENGLTLVNVPNIILQQSFAVNVYAYDGESTRHSARFDVKPRTKPADYIYTETEVKNWEEYKERIAKLEEKTFKRCFFNFDRFKNLDSVLTQKFAINAADDNRIDYIVRLKVAKDFSLNFDLPLKLDSNPSGLWQSKITNVRDFTPLLVNPYLSKEPFYIPELLEAVSTYTINSKFNLYTTIDGDYIILSFAINLYFSNFAISNAFYDEFSSVMLSTTDFVLEYTVPEEIQAEYIGG